MTDDSATRCMGLNAWIAQSTCHDSLPPDPHSCKSATVTMIVAFPGGLQRLGPNKGGCPAEPCIWESVGKGYGGGSNPPINALARCRRGG